MLPIPIRLALALLLVTGALGGAADAPPPKPLAAFATPTATGVLVGWVSPTEGVDAYNVYGLDDDGGPVLLSSTSGDTSAEVPAGYSTYAVAAVRDGVESEPTIAIGGGPCVAIHSLIPPSATVGCTGLGGDIVLP